MRHRVLFGRFAEGVPAHWVQHVVTAHALVARQHVGRYVIAAVTHVQPVAEGREEIQAIVLGAAIGWVAGAVQPGGFPGLLPARLYFVRL